MSFPLDPLTLLFVLGIIIFGLIDYDNTYNH